MLPLQMKKVKELIWGLILFIPFSLSAQPQSYKASLFNIKSDGTTLNTASIQKAIDYIHDLGGGTLEFNVGRYLTGAINLKSNVRICLYEGAILVGSTNIYDYRNGDSFSSLINADHQSNISITGKGVIDGQGRALAYNMIDQIHKGLIKDKLESDRPDVRPSIINFNQCRNVEISEVTLKNAAFWVQCYNQCENLKIDYITVDSKAYWNNDGLDIVDCNNAKVTNSFFDSSDDAICFKSEDTTKVCENVEVRNCVARSSANGIKFGTHTFGGYKNFKIINNKVYDTYRSAITIATPDGGAIENILVDSLYAYNVGNAIYLRIGARFNKDRKGSMRNITIQNMYAEIAVSKPDAGYEYEGPVEALPRNISPSGIVGLTDRKIQDVKLKNIEIVSPGGGNPFYAKRGITPKDLDEIPEMRDSYPEFSKFKELPAWGFFIRHVDGLVFENVTLTVQKKDYRPAIVMHDVKDGVLKTVKINEPESHNKKQIIQYKTAGISVQ